VGPDSIFGSKNIEDYRNILLSHQLKKWNVDPVYFKNRLFYRFPMHITVIFSVQGDFEWSYIYNYNIYKEFGLYADKYTCELF
jgi:hypothetical protein